MKRNKIFRDVLLFTNVYVRSLKVHICKTNTQIAVWVSSAVHWGSGLLASPALKQEDHHVHDSLRLKG